MDGDNFRSVQHTAIPVQPNEKKAGLQGILTLLSPSSLLFSRQEKLEDIASLSIAQAKNWVKDIVGIDEEDAQILFEGKMDGAALVKVDSAIELKELFGIAPASAKKLFSAIQQLKEEPGTFRNVSLFFV